MGYSTTSYSVLSSDMRQTPDTVNMVLDFAGWNANEAADASGVNALHIHMAASGQAAMQREEWVKLLDVCGRRVFDADDDSV